MSWSAKEKMPTSGTKIKENMLTPGRQYTGQDLSQGEHANPRQTVLWLIFKLKNDNSKLIVS